MARACVAPVSLSRCKFGAPLYTRLCQHDAPYDSDKLSSPMVNVRIAVTPKKYTGLAIKAARTELDLLRMANFVMRNITAPKPAAMAGAIPNPAKIVPDPCHRSSPTEQRRLPQGQRRLQQAMTQSRMSWKRAKHYGWRSLAMWPRRPERKRMPVAPPRACLGRHRAR